MSDLTHVTVGQVAKDYGIPEWKIRRVVDSLDVEIPRVARFRMIPLSLLGDIACRLKEQGWFPHTDKSSERGAQSKP